jgi:hypothetical protein
MFDDVVDLEVLGLHGPWDSDGLLTEEGRVGESVEIAAFALEVCGG